MSTRTGLAGTALLVIDVQNDVVSGAHDRDGVGFGSGVRGEDHLHPCDRRVVHRIDDLLEVAARAEVAIASA